MASEQQILREYLVSLGYSVDRPSEKKFDNSLLKTKINADGLLKTLIGVGTAAQTMAVLYARSMEKLYYSSIRAQSSVSNLQGLDFGGLTVGIKDLSGTVEKMAASMRSNPGLVALVEGMGVKTTGRDRSEVMLDFIEKLRAMPFEVANQFASMFGIDPDTYYMLTKSLDQLRQAAELRKQMNADAGLDVETAAAAGKEYANQLREVKALFDVLHDTVMVALLPAFKEAAGVTGQVLRDWSAIIKSRSNRPADSPGFFSDLVTGTLHMMGMKRSTMQLTPDAAKRAGEVAPGPISYPASVSSDNDNPFAMFARLEKQFGLPAGLLDRMWAKESGRGANLISPAGAKGDFQFMPGTAKQYGVDTDSLASSASGAARYVSDLLKKYGGDVPKALAGYNWGPNNVDKYGLDRAPSETRDYMHLADGLKPVTINQQTSISVTTPDPAAAGASVARAQSGVNADIVRNAGSKVQ